jgi:hypothetical protein
MTAIPERGTPDARERYRAISVAIQSASGPLGRLPDPRGGSLFSCDGAGVPQDAAKQGKHGAVGSPEVQLANLLAGQHHFGAKLRGALKLSNVVL